ncbi:hypothetical protein QE152_g6538 [Popillia japonica]|uniref:Uncharacterized protein n=1 Tax=Popillia japonica TaxID=7064 RepID=A0AAW1MEU4_POPJA
MIAAARSTVCESLDEAPCPKPGRRSVNHWMKPRVPTGPLPFQVPVSFTLNLNWILVTFYNSTPISLNLNWILVTFYNSTPISHNLTTNCAGIYESTDKKLLASFLGCRDVPTSNIWNIRIDGQEITGVVLRMP